MNIVVRVDASIEIGAGHVMRCLTLANLLHRKGAKIFFICADLQGNLCGLIEKQGFKVFRIPSYIEWDWRRDADLTIKVLRDLGFTIRCTIVDHYNIDFRWEEKIRLYCEKLMVIDDLANRKHNSDLLLDQNYYKNLEIRYHHLVPKNCQQFLGPSFLLLRPEFIEIGNRIRVRDGHVQRVLVFFSGSDPTNETMKTLEALSNVNLSQMKVDVVVGESNPNKELVQQYCNQLKNVRYYCQITNMAEMMLKADLAIGAGGVSMWERCFLGLPSITIVIAENQRETTQAVAEYGAIINLGWHGDNKPEDIADIINRVINSPLELKEMSQRALQLMRRETSNHLDILLDAIISKYSS